MATIKDDIKIFFQTKIDNLRQEENIPSNIKDYSLFTYICIKNYFFPTDDYDFSDVFSHIVDGSNDCSIDAICNANTDENELVYIQTKFRETFDLTIAIGEINEIKDSIKKLKSLKISAFNEDVLNAYRECKENTESDNFQIVYFTSAVPKKNVQKKAQETLEEDNIQIIFGDEIKSYIEGIQETTGKVANGELELDQTNNLLKFEESVIVNVSSQSLKQLYCTYSRGLLGLNLRFYTRNKTVDNGLKETITKHPNSFWYLNNGLVILADDYKIDGKILKLHGFSIVNGGQTTNAISKEDEDTNFYLPCKVIKITDKNDPYVSSEKIAEASNSQKPIKAKDLVANRPEQVNLKGLLKQKGFQYITKNGETIDKFHKERHLHGTIDYIGKLVLCTILQKPWLRSDSKSLYEDTKLYNQVYRQTNPELMVQMVKLDYFYKDFCKKKFNLKDPILARNSRTFALALLVYISYCYQINEKTRPHDTFIDQNKMDILIEHFAKMDTIILKKFDEEESVFHDLFLVLSDYIITPCYQIAKNMNTELDQSNFLKKKESYVQCLQQLNSEMNFSSFKTPLIQICDKIFAQE